jgi:hypothetical protein
VNAVQRDWWGRVQFGERGQRRLTPGHFAFAATCFDAALMARALMERAVMQDVTLRVACQVKDCAWRRAKLSGWWWAAGGAIGSIP